ncbi:unnamed protein product [Nesidiocoris tenuis]|uniref:Uncharacterized protein n=1 Tax=Nesidiocoris tenuis TaxID=355587 RepID=A0A6H5HRC9_9HEMI|nr:unnamed protein product [Nesidiocoris tenuis]
MRKRTIAPTWDGPSGAILHVNWGTFEEQKGFPSPTAEPLQIFPLNIVKRHVLEVRTDPFVPGSHNFTSYFPTKRGVPPSGPAVRQDVISSGRRRKHPSILSPLSSPSDEEVAADIPPYLTFRLSALSSDCQLQFPLRRCKVGLFTSCGPFIVAPIIIHPIQMPVSRS